MVEFIRSIFRNVNADYAEKAFPELEKYLRHKQGALVVKGRIDALLGNLVIEFESNLRVNLDQAKDQLKRYVAILWSIEKKSRVSYFAMASDGIKFEVFKPRTDIPMGRTVNENDVYLDPLDHLNIQDTEPRDVYLWLDRYLLARTLIPISSDQFVLEFGPKSTVFRLFMDAIRTIWLDSESETEVKTLFEEWAKYLRIVYGVPIESKELFFKHTYLAVLAKLMVYSSFSGGALPSQVELLKVLRGEAFKEWGILNFLEEDFFSWIVRPSVTRNGLKLATGLLSHLSRYDMRALDEDILKGLYQELVDPAERHDLGEYYTPDWLAEYILAPLISENSQRGILDPACGSGTFLFKAIRLKSRIISAPTNSDLLQHLLGNVVGIDVHPLAVIVAKANYLIALGDLVQARKTSITIPVYMADSIKQQEEKVEEYGNLRVHQFPAYEKILRIPELIIKEGGPDVTDWVISLVLGYASRVATKAITPDATAFKNLLLTNIKELDKILRESQARIDDLAAVLHKTALDIADLSAHGRDTIWGYVLRNMYKPLFLKETKFDTLVGNPPWLAYRYVQSIEYQRFLKELIIDRYMLLRSSVAELMTHMELATLFFVRAADLFLKENGAIVFVMPRGVLTADQHDAFRRRQFSSVDLSFNMIIDLEKTKPIFNISACVIGAVKTESVLPIEGIEVEGILPKKNIELKQARRYLKFIEKHYELQTIGKRSFLGAEKVIGVQSRSAYYESFSQGATIVPRSLWFVDIVKHPRLGLDSVTPFVRSSERAVRLAKEDYKGVFLEGQIESAFLYAAVTGSELIPFTCAYLPVVVLPIEIADNKFRIVDKSEARRRGFPHLADWLARAEETWKSTRGEKQLDLGVYEWIDYRKKLTQQNQNDKFKVLYTTSGTILTSSVVDLREAIKIDVDGLMISLNGLIVDHKAYYYGTNNEKEAYFLCAVLNSKTVDQHVKPIQSRGLWGPRDFHKKVLELPIPKYDSSNPDHARLAEIGRQCKAKAIRTLSQMSWKKYKSIGKIRAETRKRLVDELREIDSLLEELLKQS